MILFLGMYKWVYLFETTDKLERNYCYTKQNQLDSFTKDQICIGSDNKINIFVYNNDIDSIDNFLNESRQVNRFYKPFFLRHNHQLSKDQIFSKNQINSDSNEQTNFCVFISKRERWNYFYRNFSSCSKSQFHCLLVVFIAFGGIIGGFFFGLATDILGRKMITGVCFAVLTVATLCITLVSALLDSRYKAYENEFDENYLINSTISDSYSTILKQNYVQNSIDDLNAKLFVIILFASLTISFCIAPLRKSIGILMIENSMSEDIILGNLRKINLAENALAPFLTTILLQMINKFTVTWIIFSSLSLFFTLVSFIYLKESMRFHFEFCQWKALTKIVFCFFKTIDSSLLCTENQFRIHKNNEKRRKYESIHDFGDILRASKENSEKNSKISPLNNKESSYFKKIIRRLYFSYLKNKRWKIPY